MPTWTFVRHGQSVANLERWYAGQTDAPLTTAGEAQAIAARDALRDRLPPRAFCSDLSRAHATARHILQGSGVPLTVVVALRERYCGAWERRSIDALAENPQQVERLGTWRGRPPGGESLLDVALRVAGWAATVDDSEQDTLVVAHGALMRAVFTALDDRPRDEIGLTRPKNCEAIERSIPRGRWAEVLDQLRSEALAG